MKTFALITEGSTDQAVIEILLEEHFYHNTGEEIAINPLQPIYDTTTDPFHGEQGGWERVFDYCSDPGRLRAALAYNDFIIIQVDTDCASHENFNIPLTVNGEDRPVNAIIEDVKELLISIMTSGLHEEYKIELYLPLPYIRLSVGYCLCT